MPASTCDPVNAALRHALSSDRGSCNNSDLDSRLIVSAKSVLNSHIDFEQSETYKSTVLDNLKSKYIVLGSPNSTKATQQMTPEANNKDEEILSDPKHVLFPLEAVQLGWKESGWHTGVGMQNTGNTCYLNSTLQALFHVPALINWLVSDREHRNNCETCMVCAVAKTLLSSQSQSQQPIRPWLITSKLRLVCRHLVPGRQEDAHEFLRYLVEAMERAYIQRFSNLDNLDPRSKETTPLNQILGGYLRSAVRCLQCGHVSTTVQHFQDLLLDIRKAGTLDDALTSYFACERLDDLAYRCESCRRKVAAVKQFSLERAPFVLCIQLKRFAGAGGKITKHISFRQRLELTRFSHRKPATPLVYKLVALVTHMGMSANCGHYTAIGLTPSGSYYEFDDCSVRSVSQQIVLNTNAYIMFYELEQDSSQQSSSDKINGKITIKNKSPSTSSSSSCSSSIQNNCHQPSTPQPSPTTSSLKSSIIPSLTFKTNLIPTPIRNKNILENGKTDSNYNLLKTFNQQSSSSEASNSKLNNGSSVMNGTSSKLNGISSINRNSNSRMESISSSTSNVTDHNKNVVNDISRLLDSPERTIKENTLLTPVKSLNSNGQNGENKHDISSPKRNEINGKNGIKSVAPIINGTANRRLVPYDSDGGSTSDSEDAPSGKWLISIRPESRAPSLNGDTGWRNKGKISSTIETNGSSCTNNTVSQLMHMSHSGYGTSVVTWNGDRSELDKEVASERREQFKRHRTDVDEMDRGRAKKRRQNSSVPRSNPGYNPFQEYQQSNRRWQNGSNNALQFRTKHLKFDSNPSNFYNGGTKERYRRRFFSNTKHNRFHR